MFLAQGLLGILSFFTFLWMISENKTAVLKGSIVKGLLIQIILATLLTQFPVIRSSFEHLTKGVDALKSATEAGTSFVFGYLGGGSVPFEATGSTFIFALQALPMIMVVSALSMLMFYWGVLPWIVSKISFFWRKTMNIGGALGTAAAAKIFLGNIDAPLLVRPYLKDFSRSELFALMACGMATTSATVMALYATILKDVVPATIGHILTCSVISIPAALTIARVMIPETGKQTSGEFVMPYQFSNWMDAISKGTSDGLNIFLNVAAMLIVVLAIVALGNSALSLLPHVGGEVITFQRIFGICFAPVTWLMGVPWEETMTAGRLLGTKTVLNEVVAFIDMAKLRQGQLSDVSSLIMMYALCGFANFSAVGIVIGGMGAMVPERRTEIVGLGLKSVIAGTLATCLSGTIIGLLSRLNLF
ncbi:MAG: nucleoside:proton symporter [Alphaproteobacteria bacterium]|nr:nucleoside:proton symporter [Alphaproteobacteria bacterium]